MKIKLYTVACLALLCSVWACERPKSPDFKLDHKLQAPLTVDKTYQFLGGSESLIDTTSADFEDLFTTDSNNLVRLSKEEEFDFGDLNNAIPAIDVAPTTVNAQVGEIGLSDFSSPGVVGSAGFDNVTGFSGTYSQDNPVPAGSTPGTVNIAFNTDYFESAVIKRDGSLEIILTNNLGFNVDQITIALNAGSSTIGSDTINPFDNNDTKTATIAIPASSTLHDLNVDVSASWSNQKMEEDAGNLVVNSVRGKDLVASQVTAAVTSQSFTGTGTSNVDNSEIDFTQPDHYVGLKNGMLSVDINNQIDISISDLSITFPDIRDKTTDNLLVLDLSGIPRSSDGGQYSNSFDLAGYRIYAENNTITYNVDATTTNTQQGSGSETRTVREGDQLQASVALSNLVLNRAKGIIKSKSVLLNDDVVSNGSNTIDLFNDQEAEVVNIDGLNDISDRISNITFANPILSALYNTNLGVKTSIYAAIAGTNSDGNTVYLSGNQNSQYHVGSSEIPSELKANGQALTEDKLIKFDVDISTDGSVIQGATEFDTARTNTSEFFSNLPTSIRFIGIARLSQNNDEGLIVNPVSFNPSLGIDLPLNFSADNATFKDTVKADLGSLPGNDGDQQLSEATLTINYVNRLPFKLNMALVMLDKNGQKVTEYPLSQNPLEVQAASVDPQTGFVEKGTEKQGKLQLSFAEDQLNILNQTRSMVLNITFNTAQQQEVKIRATDSISFRMKMSVNVTSTVN